MRVLHVITGLGAGGAERILYKLLAGGQAERFPCTVVSLSDAGVYGSKIESLDVPVHTLGMRRGMPGLASLQHLRRVVRACRPELIQGWMYHGNLAAWMACRLAAGRPKLAWNIRQSLYGLSSEKPLTRQVIRANRMLSTAPAAFLYNSALSRRQHEAFGYHPRHGHVIPNGFDLNMWKPGDAGERLRVRQGLNLPPDAVVIGHVARWHPVKDHPRFLRVAVQLAKCRPELHVVMAGTDVTTRNAELQAEIPNALRGRFHLMGERDDVHVWMRGLDVLCQSSRAEAFPNVLGEAMASGVPCVATDVGDSACILGDTGVLVTPESDEALYVGLSRLLDAGPEQRHALGNAARAKIESEFSLRVMVERYAALYESICQRGDSRCVA